MISKLFSYFKNRKNVPNSVFEAEQKEKIFQKVVELVGNKPSDEQYYVKAFTHRSYLEKTKLEIKSNERLEFLGDSILSKIVAEFLFHEFPQKDEGYLTRIRSSLVNKHSLEKIGFRLDLHKLLFINDKYLFKERKKLSNMVADCLEALIAAIYLDMGEEKSREFVTKYIIQPQIETGEINKDKNYKGQLLEYAHANKMNQPEYRIIDQIGPQHDKIYTSEVSLNNLVQGIGKGPTKKIAEQYAAKDALIKLEEYNNSEK